MNDSLDTNEFEKMLQYPTIYEEKIRHEALKFPKERRIALCNALEEKLKEELKKPFNEQNSIYVEEWAKTIKILEAPQEGIKITISDSDGIYGFIHNGSDGVVKRITIKELKGVQKQIETDIMRFIGEIGPVVKIDNDLPGIRIQLNGINEVFGVREALSFLRNEFSISQNKLQCLGEVLRAFVSQEISNGNFEQYMSSPITVADGIIKVNTVKRGDLGLVLNLIRDFYPFASHKDAFISSISWALVAPLHDELKRKSTKGIQTPLLILTGKTRGGKTTLGNLIIGKGYAQSQDEYFFPYNRLHTRFALMKHLSESNLPALLDDLLLDWIIKQKEDLKSYVQTGHFGDWGRGDQTLTEYRGRRSFMGTINDEIRIDDDLALSLRFLILRFREENKQRKNKTKFDALFDSLPNGFMFEIFREVFEGEDIGNILREVENFDGVEDWINFGIGRINALLRQHNLEGFPKFYDEEDESVVDNAQEIEQAFISENDRILASRVDRIDRLTGETVNRQHLNSPIEQAFKIEHKNGRTYIYFTGPAFKTLNGRLNLRLPFKSATDFLNNIKSSDNGVRVENEGKAKAKRLGESVFKAYCISLKEERDPDEKWD